MKAAGEIARGALWGIALLAAYLVPLMLVLLPIDLILGVGQKHDTVFGLVSLVYTAGWMGAFLSWARV